MKDNPHSASDLWQAINQIIVRSSNIKSKLPGNLSLDFINEFFRTIAITQMFAPISSPQTPYTFMFRSLTVSEVLSQLQVLDIRKSVGPDGLSARFIKEVAAEIVFNKSLHDGCVPHMCKCSVHKGGSVDDLSNF